MKLSGKKEIFYHRLQSIVQNNKNLVEATKSTKEWHNQ